jgi:hypothetical protein
MQSKYPTFYSYIVNNRSCINEELLLKLKEDDNDLQREIDAAEEERKGFCVFSDDLIELVLDGEGTTEKKIDTFKEILNFSTTTASETKENNVDKKKEAYWSEFIEYAFSGNNAERMQSTGLKPSKLSNRSWYSLPCGTAKGNVELSFNQRDKTIRVAFLIHAGENDFKKIEMNKQEIQDALCNLGMVKWNNKSKTCNVSVVREQCDIADEKQHIEQYQWFVECACRLSKIIIPILLE